MRSSPDLLRVVGDDVRLQILQALLDEPMTQKQLRVALGVDSGTMSRHMRALEDIDLVARERSHGPYRLQHPRRTWALLQATSDLATDVMQGRAEDVATSARALRKAEMRRASSGADSGA